MGSVQNSVVFVRCDGMSQIAQKVQIDIAARFYEIVKVEVQFFKSRFGMSERKQFGVQPLFRKQAGFPF